MRGTTPYHLFQKMIEHLEEPIINAIINDAERIRTSLAGANPDQCCLCNRTCFSSYGLEYDLEAVVYDNKCPRCDKFSLRIIQIRGVITEGLNTARIRTVFYRSCFSPGCEGPLVPPLSGAREQERQSMTIPTPRLLNLRAEQHHLSYEPERTILVCRQCHGKIHAGKDGLEPLQPDQSRAEGLGQD